MNRIKEVLKGQGRSQRWLATRLGKSYVTITSNINNKTQPKIETLYRIAEILDVDVKVLLVKTKK